MPPDGAREPLAELTRLVAPPAEPVAVAGDWSRFSALNGFEPPAEWVALLDRYGCGSIGGEAIQLRDPFPTVGTFTANSDDERRWLRGTIAEHGHYPSWPVWPEPGGFLVWADLRDGSGEIGWLTEGDPDRWRVAVLERGGSGKVTDLGVLDYLLHLARHIGDEDFERHGLGWMDDATTIAYRPVAAGPTGTETILVTFAAVPSAVANLGPTDGSEDLFARAARLRSELAPTRQGWDRRWADAAPAIERAAAAGIVVTPCALVGSEPGWVHPKTAITFPNGSEQRARAALGEIAVAAATTIVSLQDAERRPVWSDLTDPDPEHPAT